MKRGRTSQPGGGASVRHAIGKHPKVAEVDDNLFAVAAIDEANPPVQANGYDNSLAQAAVVEHAAPDTPAFRAATSLDPERLARARTVAAETLPADLTTLSARVPPRLLAYLSNYAQRHNAIEPDGRKHINKQDAVAEALALLYSAYPLPPSPTDG